MTVKTFSGKTRCWGKNNAYDVSKDLTGEVVEEDVSTFVVEVNPSSAIITPLYPPHNGLRETLLKVRKVDVVRVG